LITRRQFLQFRLRLLMTFLQPCEQAVQTGQFAASEGVMNVKQMANQRGRRSGVGWTCGYRGLGFLQLGKYRVGLQAGVFAGLGEAELTPRYCSNN
jgi:hypothetical protein